MNLFILDKNPILSATYHVDKHVVKMPTETAQMLSFAYHLTTEQPDIPEFIMEFSKTHSKHPCSIWMRESIDNFLFSAQLGLALYEEYQYRYNQPDKHIRAKKIFEYCLLKPPTLPSLGLTPYALAMDKSFICSADAIENYRYYYRIGKSHIHAWKNRDKPYWI